MLSKRYESTEVDNRSRSDLSVELRSCNNEQFDEVKLLWSIIFFYFDDIYTIFCNMNQSRISYTKMKSGLPEGS